MLRMLEGPVRGGSGLTKGPSEQSTWTHTLDEFRFNRQRIARSRQALLPTCTACRSDRTSAEGSLGGKAVNNDPMRHIPNSVARTTRTILLVIVCLSLGYAVGTYVNSQRADEQIAELDAEIISTRAHSEDLQNRVLDLEGQVAQLEAANSALVPLAAQYLASQSKEARQMGRILELAGERLERTLRSGF